MIAGAALDVNSGWSIPMPAIISHAVTVVKKKMRLSKNPK